jgi:hypothetical protein
MPKTIMDISNSPVFKTFKKILTLLVLLAVVSCEEWTPAADGYFVVNHKRYPVHIMVIYKDTNYNPEIVLQGAPYVNATMFVSTSSSTLTKGTYGLSAPFYEPMSINSLNLRYGKTSPEINADKDSEGSMTVEVSGINYVLDFKGTIGGYPVEIHYSGLVSQQSF